MTEATREPQDGRLFSALLTPHRSLGPRGFMVLMSAVCLVSFGTGLLFYMIGAWPVMGFMGLDVALIYVAFKLELPRRPPLRDGRPHRGGLDRHAGAALGPSAGLELQSLLGAAETRGSGRQADRAVDRLAWQAPRHCELPVGSGAGGFRPRSRRRARSRQGAGPGLRSVTPAKAGVQRAEGANIKTSPPRHRYFFSARCWREAGYSAFAGMTYLTYKDSFRQRDCVSRRRCHRRVACRSAAWRS